VWFADNGIEAVKLWQKYKPHLIWMDLRMPVLDGFQAAQKIRARPNGSNTKIIALSANAFVKTQELAMSNGFDDFVAKPFPEAVIFEKMALHLGVRYIYEEDSAIESERDEPVVQLTSESISVLPRESIEKLYNPHSAVLALMNKDFHTFTVRKISVPTFSNFSIIISDFGEV
jgi:CheY-like chemotaxis protein